MEDIVPYIEKPENWLPGNSIHRFWRNKAWLDAEENRSRPEIEERVLDTFQSFLLQNLLGKCQDLRDVLQLSLGWFNCSYDDVDVKTQERCKVASENTIIRSGLYAGWEASCGRSVLADNGDRGPGSGNQRRDDWEGKIWVSTVLDSEWGSWIDIGNQNY
jgi:hypothetical protein